MGVLHPAAACLTPGCAGLTAAGRPYLRCIPCREEHQRKKAAEAAANRRERQRVARWEARERAGKAPEIESSRRPRTRTESWDHLGRAVAAVQPVRDEQLLLQVLDRLERLEVAVRLLRDSD